MAESRIDQRPPLVSWRGQRPRGVLFDLDDTLFDHRGAARAALAGVHSSHAGTPAFEVFERQHAAFLEEVHLDVLAGRRGLDDARRERFRRLFRANGIDLSADEIDAVAAAYRAGYLPAWRPVDGALALVTAVRAHARVGVISNNLMEETREKIEFCGLAPLVDVVVASGDEGISKPDPRIFAVALDRLEVTKAEAVMFGDSWAADITGAARAGIRAVWFNPTRKARPADPPDVVDVSSLTPAADVMAVLLGGARARP